MTREMKWYDNIWTLKIAEPGYSSKMSERQEDGRYPKHYHVYIHEVGLLPYLLWRAYHWYDMRIPLKIPGWAWFISWWCTITGAENRAFPMEGEPEARWRDRLVGWDINQDIRCYELSPHHICEKGLLVELTKEQYAGLKDKEMEELDRLEEERFQKRKAKGIPGYE